MAAFTKIYETYARPVYRFLFALTGSEDQAEEFLQETFYRAFLHIDQFEGRSSLYTWLCQIGKNAWLKECRRSGRFETVEELSVTVPSAESQVLVKEEQARLRRAVYALEEPYKEVFILHVYGDVKLKDIAQAHGKSESWARVTYHRARARVLEEVSK